VAFGVFSAGAQVPNAPQAAVPLPAPFQIRTNPLAITPGGADLTTRTLPRQLPPPRSNSIVNTTSSSISTNVAGTRLPGTVTVANPAPAVDSNAPPDEILQPGLMDFKKADLDQVLMFYAELVNRTILRSAQLPQPQIVLKTQTPLTRSEAKQALDAVLALNGIAMVNVGDKFVKAAPLAAAGQLGQEFNKGFSDDIPNLGQYITHVVQLKFLKPSEVVQVLQPFASPVANPIFPIDASQILVLRDLAENVKRMLEMLREIDVSVPSEYISEVIPIKYAKASEIASAINSLSSGGGGATVGGGTSTGTRSLSGSRTGGSSRFGQSGTGVSGYQGQQGQNSFGQGMQPQATAAPTANNSFTSRLQNLVSRAASQGDIVVLNQTKMIADERTNSLLIYASREDMKTIQDIIKKLDVVLAQVLIEAVIIEVTLNDIERWRKL